MRYLLDTHTFLWWIGDDQRLSERAREIIRDPANEIVFSAASAWEIAIKARIGRIAFQQDLTTFIPEQLHINGFAKLSIEVRHTLRVAMLPALHRDPFDRILVAQAMLEELPLLSRDAAIARYDVPIIW